jgi:hypothetical protein
MRNVSRLHPSLRPSPLWLDVHRWLGSTIPLSALCRAPFAALAPVSVRPSTPVVIPFRKATP